MHVHACRHTGAHTRITTRDHTHVQRGGTHKPPWARAHTGTPGPTDGAPGTGRPFLQLPHVLVARECPCLGPCSVAPDADLWPLRRAVLGSNLGELGLRRLWGVGGFLSCRQASLLVFNTQRRPASPGPAELVWARLLGLRAEPQECCPAHDTVSGLWVLRAYMPTGVLGPEKTQEGHRSQTNGTSVAGEGPGQVSPG